MVLRQNLNRLNITYWKAPTIGSSDVSTKCTSGTAWKASSNEFRAISVESNFILKQRIISHELA